MNRLHDSHRIGLIGGLILAGLTLASGFAVYIVMQRQAEAILVKSLEASLRSDRRLFESEIEASLANALTVSTRPFVIRNLKQLRTQPGDTASRLALQQIADSFLPIGFTGITFYDSRDIEVAHAGSLSDDPALSVPLNTHVESRLLWNRGFILQVIRDVVDESGMRIGTARAEAALPNLTHAIRDTGDLGETAELAVCAPSGTTCSVFR